MRLFPCLSRLPAALSALLLSLLCSAPVHGSETVSPTPPSLLLAQSYSATVDPRDFLVSEKLDGVRAYWDGRDLYFRSGRKIVAPLWFTAGFPKRALDGELWMGRQRFDALSAAVRRQEPSDAEWKDITYQLYELPNGEGGFSERVAALQKIAAEAGVTWLQVVPQLRIGSKKALSHKLAETVRAGGEGLMLHRADAPWQTGRSDALLKLKPLHDAEAVVVAHETGKGKYSDMMGALLLQMPDGRRFRLGTGFTDAERRNPPPVGSTVTYRYRELTVTGLPRFASYWRVRLQE